MQSFYLALGDEECGELRKRHYIPLSILLLGSLACASGICIVSLNSYLDNGHIELSKAIVVSAIGKPSA